MNILQMSLCASAIILFAMLLRPLVRSRLPKTTLVALWLLAAVRMLLPWELPFRFSVGALLQNSVEPAVREAAPVAAVAIQQASEPVATAIARVQSAKIPVWHIVWLVGLAACALALLLPHLRWRQVYARSLPLEDAYIADWLCAQRRVGRVRMRISDEIPAPLTCGLLRPLILLPANMDRSDARRMEYVLAHELTHVRRLDALWKLVFAAALCAHWFNPLAWAMYLLANRDIELACDEAVLRRRGDPARRDYACTLLDLAACQNGLPSPLFSGFSRSTIEERIRAIMKMKRFTKIAALIAVLLVAFSALAFATTAEPKSRVIDNEIQELMFDGYEDMSINDYIAYLDALGFNSDLLSRSEEGVSYESEYEDFLYFVIDSLTDADFKAQGICTKDMGMGTENLKTGEYAEAYCRVTCQVLDPERVTVGYFYEALEAVLEGMQAVDLLETTQAKLEERMAELATEWSDGETIAFEVMIEKKGEESPYSDPEIEALLKKYTVLGLEYNYTLGELSMSYQGVDVQGIWDPEAGTVTGNSTGPKGLGGDNILEVIYEDGMPAELHFIEKAE